MSLAADVVTILAGTPAVANLCVTNSKTSTKAIRPDRLSQSDKLTNSLGAIEVTASKTDYQTDLNGSGKTAIITLLIDCVGLGSTVANAIADKVEDTLEPYRGATSGGNIDAVELLDRREDWATTDDGTDNGEYVVELEINVIYRRN